MREKPIQKKRPAHGSGHGAEGKRGDADALDQQQSADDGAETVDERRHGLNRKLLAHQQHRAKDAAGEETQLRGQQNAREQHAEGGFLRVETAEPPAHEPGSKDFGQNDGRAQNQVHGGEDDGERTLAFGLAPGLAIAGEDGDEGDGGRAADEKVGDHVGQEKAALKASACTPLPKSHAMYLMRTRPMMRERNVETISTTVAEKMLCAWEGCRRPKARAHRERGGG